MKCEIILIALFFLCFCVGVQAQKELRDIVYLKNGSVIRGKVLEYDPQKTIKIKIVGETVLVYPSSDVLKIENKNLQNINEKRVSQTIMVNTIGVFFATYGFRIFPAWGVGIDYTVGYQFHRLFCLGGGLGVKLIYGSIFFPVYANIRGYWFKTSASMYYDLDIGYGYAYSSGGIAYIRPAIGFRFASTKRVHMALDIGCDIQTYTVFPSLRLGVTF